MPGTSITTGPTALDEGEPRSRPSACLVCRSPRRAPAILAGLSRGCPSGSAGMLSDAICARNGHPSHPVPEPGDRQRTHAEDQHDDTPLAQGRDRYGHDQRDGVIFHLTVSGRARGCESARTAQTEARKGRARGQVLPRTPPTGAKPQRLRGPGTMLLPSEASRGAGRAGPAVFRVDATPESQREDSSSTNRRAPVDRPTRHRHRRAQRRGLDLRDPLDLPPGRA